MNCPNCNSKNIEPLSVPAVGEVCIRCNDCELYSTLYQEGNEYISPNEINQSYIEEEKIHWQNC
jgi:hypothetical protein